MKRTAFLLFVILAAASLLAACSLFGKQQTPKDMNAISTLAQQTVMARQTQAAFETLVAQLTQVIQNTPVPPQVTVQAASPTWIRRRSKDVAVIIDGQRIEEAIDDRVKLFDAPAAVDAIHSPFALFFRRADAWRRDACGGRGLDARHAARRGWHDLRRRWTR